MSARKRACLFLEGALLRAQTRTKEAAPRIVKGGLMPYFETYPV